MDNFEARLKSVLDSTANITTDFDLNPQFKNLATKTPRPAAVLVPIDVSDGQAKVILTKRSSALRHHPGQIAFPGGKVEAFDASVTDAALREANEEIGITSDVAQTLGNLPNHITVTGFTVTPVVALIERRFDERIDKGEVDEVFRVPLDFLMTPSNFQIQSRKWQGTERFYYTVPVGPYYIWGATARILRGLAERYSNGPN